MKKDDVILFFSCDELYAPYFAVTLESIRENADKNRRYVIKCLNTGNITDKTAKIITDEYSKDNFFVEFVDITEDVAGFSNQLHTRDYYTKSTYYRLFIPRLYPEFDKALYLDCDVILKRDVAELFDVYLGENYVAAVPDESVQIIKEFQDYVENRIGVKSYREYFNAGVLLMNCRKLREINFEDMFGELIGKVTFNVAQDQDYLNAICKGNVLLLGTEWDKMPISEETCAEEDVKLIHFNLDFKPWRRDGVLYEEYFWKCAEKTVFSEKIKKHKSECDPALALKARWETEKLIGICKEQAADEAENAAISAILEELGRKYGKIG